MTMSTQQLAELSEQTIREVRNRRAVQRFMNILMLFSIGLLLMVAIHGTAQPLNKQDDMATQLIKTLDRVCEAADPSKLTSHDLQTCAEVRKR